MKKYLPILIILGVSLLTHFLYFGYPNATVFDEVHFGRFVTGYFTHEYYFDIHPPLGKLLISLVGYLTGYEAGFSFENIGDSFPDNAYLWLRLLPTLAGTLLPLVLYALARVLGLSRLTATFVGLLVAVESALIVQSRFILLDSFLLLFGFASLWLYFCFRREKRIILLLGAFVLASLAASVKWTGLSFMGLIGVMELIDVFRKSPRVLMRLVAGTTLAGIVYFGLFAVHLKLLYRSGPGDAFMTPEFKKTLIGSPDSTREDIESLSLFQKFTQLNMVMYRSNAGLTATHPNQSTWYSWPFLTEPIFYWSKDTARIYLLGNPIVWYASTFAILYLIVYLISELPNIISKKTKINSVLWLLVLGFVVNLLPFFGVTRALFLYHYFPAYIFAIMGLGYLVQQLPYRKYVAGAIILASIGSFIYFLPLTYGLPLTPEKFSARVWMSSWR